MVGCETELLIKHLVGSGSTEVVETEYHTVGTYNLAECRGKTGGETEGGNTGSHHRLAVVGILEEEETERGN